MLESLKKTILLVEDEAILALSEKMALEQYGYTVTTMSTGEKAVEAVNSLPKIDLILMDIDLGNGIDGTQTAEMILRDHDIPIVFVSSHSEREIVEKTEKITSYGYVVKSSSITVLDASIKMAFKLFDAKTATQKKEKLIHESEEKYRLLYESAGIGIGYYSLEGIVLSYNKLAAQHMGGVPENFIGKSISQLFPSAEGRIYLDRLTLAATAEGSTVYEDLVELPSGTTYFVSTFTRVTDLGGRLLGVQIISQDITQRKNAELAVIESKEMFGTLANLAPVGIYLTNPNGDCTYANPAWCKMAGLTLEEAKGQGWIKGLHPDDTAKVFSKWNEMIASKGGWGLEYRFQDRNGAVTDVYGLASAQFDIHGNVLNYIGVNIDITERKVVEGELMKAKSESEKNENDLNTMMHMIKDIIVCRDLDDKVIYFNNAFDDVTKKLFSKPAYIGMNTLDSLPPDKKTFWKEILLKVKNGEKHCEEYSFPLPSGGMCYYQTTHEPIVQENKIVGTLELTKDITAQKEIENELRYGEEKYRAIVENSIDYIMRYDRDCRHIFGNSMAINASGLTAEQYVGKNHRDLGFPEHLCVLWETNIEKVFDTGITQTVEFEVELAGDIRYLELKLSPEFDVDGIGVKSVIGISRDITKLRRLLEELQKNEKRYNKAQEVANVGSWEYDIASDVFWGSAEAKRTYGFDAESDSFTAAEVMKCVIEPDFVNKAMVNLITINEPYDIEFSITPRNSRDQKVIHSVAELLKDAAGNPIKVIGVLSDITEKKKTELELSRSRTLLKSAEAAAKIGGWEFDVETLKQFWTEETFRILEIDLSNGEPDVPEGLDFILPEYRVEAEKAIQRAIQYGESYDQEWEIITRKGNKKWVHSIATAYQEGGKTKFILGSFQDISDRKNSDLLLKESEFKFKTLANSGRALIWNSGTDKLCNYFNKIWLEFTGRSLGQEMGNGWTEGIHPDDIEECFNIYVNAFDKREMFSMQYRLRRFDGEYRWIIDEGCPQYDHAHGFIGYIGHCLDITENKLAENKIKLLLAEKELILREVHHRLKNNMNTISGFLSIQAQGIKEFSARTAFEDSIRRIQSMGILYDKLYRAADFLEMSVKDYLPALVNQVIANFPNSTKVKAETSIDDFVLDAKRLQPIGIIINELLTNSMKYAFKGKESGLVSVSATKTDKRITITVYDDGIGIPESLSFANSTGFGLQLVQALTEQLNGTIGIERGIGSRIALEFEA